MILIFFKRVRARSIPLLCALRIRVISSSKEPPFTHWVRNLFLIPFIFLILIIITLLQKVANPRK